MSNKSLRLCFLDIDGVVNSDAWFDSSKLDASILGLSDGEFMLCALEHHIDPAAIRLVNELITDSGATVILSSSWRHSFTIKSFNEFMQGKGGATFAVMDFTPKRILNEKLGRGGQIQAYLDFCKNTGVNVESFVIIDDVNEMGNLEKFLVLTDSKIGITKADVAKAHKILDGEV
ncbi:MAG TPA: HAD domain-containing protein [Candidatus Saccharimonadales bacterium]